jgi:hypothetical protein
LTLLAILLSALAVARIAAVPAPPANLTAQVAGSMVTLSWAASAGAINYLVEAGTGSGLSNVAVVNVGSMLSLSANAPNGTYYVRVRAIGLDGPSGPSNEVIVTVATGGCPAPPNPPANLTAAINGQMVTLTWVSGGGCPATNYQLRVGSGPGLSNIAVLDLGPALSVMGSVSPGTYYIRVLARNAAGTSAASNEVIVQVGTTPVGIIVLANDDWLLSDVAFNRLPVDTSNLVVNLGRLLAPRTGRIHIYSDYFSLTGVQLATTLRNAGFTVTTSVNISFDVATLSTYDAVLLGVPFATPAQLQVLDQYVARGGNLYIHGGNGAAVPNLVPNTWNPLLTRYGLSFTTGFNGLLGNITVTSGYPLLNGVSRVYIDQGHPLGGCCVVARAPNGAGLFAVSRGGQLP